MNSVLRQITFGINIQSNNKHKLVLKYDGIISTNKKLRGIGSLRMTNVYMIFNIDRKFIFDMGFV